MQSSKDNKPSNANFAELMSKVINKYKKPEDKPAGSTAPPVPVIAKATPKSEVAKKVAAKSATPPAPAQKEQEVDI